MKLERSIAINLLKDWSKSDINKFERARFIETWLKKDKMSIRQLSNLSEIPKSTIESWLVYNKITESEYNKLRKIGFSELEICKSIRKHQLKKTKLDVDLEQFLIELRKLNKSVKSLIKIPPNNSEIEEEIISLRNNLGRLLMYIEKKRNKKEINENIVSNKK